MSDKSWAIESSEAKALLAEDYALLRLKGVGVNECVKRLKPETNLEVTRTRLETLRNHPKYIEVMEKSIASKIKDGEVIARSILADNADIFANCLIKEAKAGNVKAAAEGIRFIIGKEEAQQEQKQAIQIVMAGTPTPSK